MTIIDVGSGPAAVLIPGIQGRWEWMRPAVEALSRSCRVITFSLADEPGARAAFDERRGFGNYVEQVRQALDERGLDAATICGVSYGGLVAAAFASAHPERTLRLVLVSALPPEWTPNRRVRCYLRAPRLLSPFFCLGALRLYPEIAAAHGGYLAGLRPALRHGWNAVTHPFSPRRMARRVSLLSRAALGSQVRHLTVPTLLLTGEAALDRVVPVRRTGEYANLCADVEARTIPRTGHLGLITKPEAFAGIVSDFAHRPTIAPRRHVG